LKKFAKTREQPKFKIFNKLKKLWVAGILQKKHGSMIEKQSHLYQLRDGPQHWVMVVVDCLAIFENLLCLGTCGNTEWIR
jgi:hypothetical protein